MPSPVAVRERQGISSEPVHAAGAACGYNQGLALYDEKFTAGQVPDGDAAENIVLNQYRMDIAFIISNDVGVFLQRVIQRLHLEEARFISGEGGAVE